MARPYSDDLRARIGAAVRDGCTVREAADLYDVSAATAARCGKRLRECGSAAAKAMGGARRDVLAGHKDWLRGRLKAVPDLTLSALVAELADRGLHVGRWAVWKFCRDETLSVKKSILPSEQDRPCLVRRRALWRRLAAVVSRKRLVFVDGREQAPPVRAPRPTGPGPT